MAGREPGAAPRVGNLGQRARSCGAVGVEGVAHLSARPRVTAVKPVEVDLERIVLVLPVDVDNRNALVVEIEIDRLRHCSFKIMGQVGPVDLIVSDRATNDLTTVAFTSADTSVLLPGAKIGIQRRLGTWAVHVLHPSGLEMPDKWGPRPIQISVKLLYADPDGDFVLLRLSSTDMGAPTEFFVYGLPFGKGYSATLIKLEVPPESWASESFGLVHHRTDYGNYVVANLKSEFNPKTGDTKFLLNRWWCNQPSWKSEIVTLTSRRHMGNSDYLQWVDLRQRRIIRCSNPLQKGNANVTFGWF